MLAGVNKRQIRRTLPALTTTLKTRFSGEKLPFILPQKHSLTQFSFENSQLS
jgi:hypothetical protein